MSVSQFPITAAHGITQVLVSPATRVMSLSMENVCRQGSRRYLTRVVPSGTGIGTAANSVQSTGCLTTLWNVLRCPTYARLTTSQAVAPLATKATSWSSVNVASLRLRECLMSVAQLGIGRIEFV